MSTVHDLTHLPAHVLAADIAARRVSPVEVIDAVIAKVNAQEPQLHAFVETYLDEARLAAEAADKAIRSGHAIGPFHGMPIALKDLVEMEGRIATGGSKVWAARRATRTATLARKLIAAGMIVIGKTHTVEFAFGGWGTNQHMGTPRNPWDMRTHRVPGGSSSGSGVAVAARLVPWAIGTDTGGSVRLPASFCGVTGLKTTIGRISCHGVLPLTPTLDTPGPIARSVEDAALLYQLLQGEDPLDKLTIGQPAAAPLAALKRGVRGLRLARIPESERAGVAPDILAAYDQALETLARAGAQVSTIALPKKFGDYTLLTSQIMQTEAFGLVGDLALDETLPIDESVRARILAGAKISAADYFNALRARDVLKAEFAAAFAEFDAVLTPTTAMTAIPVEDVDQSVMPSHFTRFVNILDLCGLAVPTGISAAGLPTSLQIVCRGYDEDTALRIGWAYQSVTDWHERVPAGF
ncbi:amidase [Acidocella sp.]|jgi:aspartyl-tRNA(Asn)/glutamyl-tRNA(Gln) amidotransferase subunit A|uniref:amidase n=1 Tax=Acidocella sp. TaxID=50710 RepID=UPI002F3FD451